MKNYIIYEHKFKTSTKSYIGYTSLSIFERLHKHYVNAMSGLNTKFYRAIRKYGISDIESNILFLTNDLNIAKEKEKEFIQIKDTFKNGYNMTLGGDGGDCTLYMTEKQKKAYFDKKKINATGINNPKYSGYTDEEIVLKAVDYFLENKKITRLAWFKFCKDRGYPVNYSKFRFNGKKYNGFIENLKIKLKELNITFTEDQFLISKKERYSGKVFSKISDDEILKHAIEYYKENLIFVKSKWFKYCKLNGLPQTYSQNRFGGLKYDGLINCLKEEFKKINIDFVYKKLANQFDKDGRNVKNNKNE